MRSSTLTTPTNSAFASPSSTTFPFPTTPGRYAQQLERTRSVGSGLNHARTQSGGGGGHVRGQSFSSKVPPSPGPAPPGVAEYEWTEIQSR